MICVDTSRQNKPIIKALYVSWSNWINELFNLNSNQDTSNAPSDPHFS